MIDSNWDRMDGFAKMPERKLSEASLEEFLVQIKRAEGHAFFTWTTCLLYKIIRRVQEHGSATASPLVELRGRWDEMQRHPQQRKEFVPLFEGDKLVGQLTIFRPRDARDFLPFVERVHPDDERVVPPQVEGTVPNYQMRIQRFNLYKGRYVLAGTET